MNWTPERIKALRERLGTLEEGGKLTQEKFANKIGMSRAASISDLENGRTKPKNQTIMLLDMLYDKHKDEIESETGPLFALAEEEEEEESQLEPV